MGGGRAATWCILLLASGCGRVGFEPSPGVVDGADGGGDDGNGAPTCVEGDQRVSSSATGHCYMRFDDVLDWVDASTACDALEGTTHLVTIGDAEENALVATVLPVNSVWIGLHDRATEGAYEWITGEPFGYTNWAAGEPNNTNNAEDCVDMHGSADTRATQWNDNFCGNAKPYGCEREP